MAGWPLCSLARVAEVDVVIVSFNSAEELPGCVAPLAEAEEVDIFVVDNASQDASREVARELPVTLVPLAGNRGFAHGCNVGWRAGSSPFVLFLNPDATLDAASLERLVATARSSEAVGIAAPRIVEPDGTLDFSQRRFPRLRTTYAQALFLHRLFPRADWSDEVIRDRDAYDRPGSPDWASGACLLVPRAVLQRLEGLDDCFFLYCEDLDLCRRVRGLGLDVRYVPDAVAVHQGGRSAPRAALIPVLAASRVRYAHKHAPRARALLERLGIALGSLTHALITRGGAAGRQGNLRALRQTLRPRAGRAAADGEAA
jgi:GT2 family glycosyltransferase